MNRPTKFHIMRANRASRARTLRIEQLAAEARALGLDEEDDPYEILRRGTQTVPPQAAAAIADKAAGQSRKRAAWLNLLCVVRGLPW